MTNLWAWNNASPEMQELIATLHVGFFLFILVVWLLGAIGKWIRSR